MYRICHRSTVFHTEQNPNNIFSQLCNCSVPQRSGDVLNISHLVSYLILFMLSGRFFDINHLFFMVWASFKCVKCHGEDGLYSFLSFCTTPHDWYFPQQPRLGKVLVLAQRAAIQKASLVLQCAPPIYQVTYRLMDNSETWNGHSTTMTLRHWSPFPPHITMLGTAAVAPGSLKQCGTLTLSH